ncbi:Carbon-nitrogen hydrolase [Vanrija albida]|uniref:Carbon-nitrogen hydrolase n=1 Tax=Vanrija albida TaxID=181172 RepID=A0ABR3PTP9_9TREE
MTKVAIAQILSTHDVKHNLAVSAKVVRDAVAEGAKAVFLPEAADFIARSADETFQLSAPLSKHEYTQGLQALAKELGVVISAGVHDLPEADEKDDEPEGSLRVYNTHVLIGTEGQLLARYRKIHLFDVELQQAVGADGVVPAPKRTGESDRVRPGKEIVAPVAVDGLGKIGLEICYDLRFPELHIIQTRLGADILTFPSAFTLKTGKDHWATLLRGIAIQFQVYVLASAQYGAHNPQRSSWGEALAFDPWGRQLGRLRSVEDDGDKAAIDKVYAEGGEYFLTDIDLEAVTGTRKQIPLAFQKRSDIYGVVGKELPPHLIE